MKKPFVHGPAEPETPGERHRTVTIALDRQRLTVRCRSQAVAWRLKGRLIAAFEQAANDPEPELNQP